MEGVRLKMMCGRTYTATRGGVTSGKWIADYGEWWGAGGKLRSLNFQAMKTQDTAGSSQGSFQGGLHAPMLLFAQGCPADELMSLPRMIQDTFGEPGPQMLCSQISLENQLMIIVPLSLGLGEEGHNLPFCSPCGSVGLEVWLEKTLKRLIWYS